MWEGAICCPRSAIISTSDPASVAAVAQANFFWGRELPIFSGKTGKIAVLHKIYFYIIFLSMGRYSLTESPS